MADFKKLIGCLKSLWISALVGTVSTASQVAAQDQRLLPYSDILDFYGGRGCTIHTRTFDEGALVAAGFAEDAAIGLTVDMVTWNLAERQGEYVVLSPLVCAIRLPDLPGGISVDDPKIQAAAPYLDEVIEYEDGYTIINRGCFFTNGVRTFENIYDGDIEAANLNYLQFLAREISSGALRFYSPNPLSTPLSFQITTGDCARAPNIAAINHSLPVLTSQFGTFVRRIGDETECGDQLSYLAGQIGAELQGAVMFSDEEDPRINAFLGFEMQLIAMGAGWYEGMSATQRGEPRPPLCHYPAD